MYELRKAGFVWKEVTQVLKTTAAAARGGLPPTDPHVLRRHRGHLPRPGRRRGCGGGPLAAPLAVAPLVRAAGLLLAIGRRHGPRSLERTRLSPDAAITRDARLQFPDSVSRGAEGSSCGLGLRVSLTLRPPGFVLTQARSAAEPPLGLERGRRTRAKRLAFEATRGWAVLCQAKKRCVFSLPM